MTIELTAAQHATLHAAAVHRWLVGLHLRTATKAERPALEATETWLSAEIETVLQQAAREQGAK